MSELTRGQVIAKVAAGESLAGYDLRELDLHKASLIGAYLRKAYLKRANLVRADLIGANLSEANLVGAKLRKACLRGANLRDANLIGVDLSGADLSGANLTGAKLIKADFSGANLSMVKLSGADLTMADLQGAKLNEAELCMVDFTGAKLVGAELMGADLSGANLLVAKLRWAKLNNAILKESNFDSANFADTDLSGADLSGVNLWNVNTSNWKIKGLRCDYVYNCKWSWIDREKEKTRRSFTPGEFEQMYHSAPQMELIFSEEYRDIDHRALLAVLSGLNRQLPQAGIRLYGLRRKVNTTVTIQAKSRIDLEQAAELLPRQYQRLFNKLSNVDGISADPFALEQSLRLMSLNQRQVVEWFIHEKQWPQAPLTLVLSGQAHDMYISS